MSTQTLLIELGTEELPPKSLVTLAESFQKSLLGALIEAELVDNDAQVTNLSSPRRLAFSLKGVSAQQKNQTVERKGPAVKSAFKEDGSPTPALLGFTKSCNAEIDDLERRETDKGEWLFFKQTVAGKSIDKVVQTALEMAIKRLPIAKRMRWGSSDVEFVRPVHWLVCLYGDKTLPVQLLGLTAGNQSQGHRFHSGAPINIDQADNYQDLLHKQGSVIVDFEERKQSIETSINKLAASVKGNIEDDPALLNEVSALVELPQPILGDIDERFMNIPQESLVSSMRDHQKYFHIVDDNGKLLPHFITVSNIKSSDEERVRSGNERVLRARLSDAEFFWETDKKSKLEDGLAALVNVTYHAKLGSMASKVTRLETLASKLAPLLKADSTKSIRIAKLAKADLTSNMVNEFSDLQGIMGKYYANNDGEDAVVAEAIEQHYWPKSADSALPKSLEAQTVALADKLDSLVGIYGVGEVPTGDKDPYALRRAALGIINILTANNHDLSLTELVALASHAYQKQGIEISDESQQSIVNFVQGRYKPYYQSKKYDTSMINAVSASGMDKPVDFAARITALDVFEDFAEASDLSAANKRINNILKKVKDTASLEGDVNTSLLESGAEADLHKAIETVASGTKSDFDKGDYEAGLKSLATLRDPIDTFFDNVMVMADDDTVKTNRLRILHQLRSLFSRVADLGQLK